ncbi:PilW family protein [Pyxidicoccus xibeiensis]|uniref:PilW family protein n=1 Tax=Pyxidicoccus xibeiensis TaxID=2906759 RepID=UPI0020A7A6B4|nr:prepilin-type N-terminal cleavage/methylation domain-containing protein [Pyxidicoccus xibeiensis]MCP3144153.1 prepilin-type N-terminal cleavage/methylation domain-containing protein [Pyxidicoccus xibeiensis]
MRRSALQARGFTLIEMMIASSLSLAVLAGAVTVGVALQRRGILEERTMETQNTSRAARELLIPAMQRAGAGFGKARLNVGGDGAQVDQRYAVWVTTNATFPGDPSFAGPTGVYAGLISDAVEIWDADSARAVQLRSRLACGNAIWDGAQLCAQSVGVNAPPANSLSVVTNPTESTACVGVVGAARTTETIAWTAGAPNQTLPAGAPCSTVAASGNVFTGSDSYLMPLNVRAYRVNWRSGRPVLEVDPDGSAGGAGYQPLAQDIERLKVRMGVYNPDLPNNDVVFFPEANAGRPALDACTNATCWSKIPGDAGTVGAAEFGPRSARDELMRRVRLMEVLITARTPQMDVQAAGADGGTTRDEEGNLVDGFKRRHSLQRIAPRNFAISGGT